MRIVKDLREHLKKKYEAGEKPPYYIYVTSNEYEIMMEAWLHLQNFQELNNYETLLRTEYGEVIIVITDVDDV